MPQNTRNKIAVMQAYVNGETIEMSPRGTDAWGSCNSPTWDWDEYEYRVSEDEGVYLVVIEDSLGTRLPFTLEFFYYTRRSVAEALAEHLNSLQSAITYKCQKMVPRDGAE